MDKTNKKTLYLECYSGISGDTTVAALLDLGADRNVLLTGLESLKVKGYRIEIGRRTKKSIDACDFNVILDETEYENEHEHGHVHDHEHEHENEHEHEHEHEHKHDHEHDHEHEHEHEHELDHEHEYEYEHEQDQGQDQGHDHNHNHDHIHFGHHDHRNLYEINSIIDQSDITPHAKDIAKRIFHIIAVAESKAHGKPVEEVHFHEVGAVDSIVDIVATAICLDNLDIHDVIVSELHEGTGQIRCQHGIIPIPVPAVANIVTEYNLPLHITSVKGEMVTPTGAGIVAAIKTRDSLPESFQVIKIGLGAGKREFEHANVLRAMLIEDTTSQSTSATTDTVWVLEANIDDCSGEALSMAMDLLFQNGAKDVYYTPIYMKKNRPAYMLGVICSEADIEKLEELIFTHTSTIGIRKHEDYRTILEREHKTVETPYGKALVKVCTYNKKQFFYPEYESIKKLCLESGVDYITVYSIVQSLAHNK